MPAPLESLSWIVGESQDLVWMQAFILVTPISMKLFIDGKDKGSAQVSEKYLSAIHIFGTSTHDSRLKIKVALEIGLKPRLSDSRLIELRDENRRIQISLNERVWPNEETEVDAIGNLPPLESAATT